MRVFVIHLNACFFHTFVCVFLSYICMRVCMLVFFTHLYACFFHTFLHLYLGWPWRSGECGRPITRGLAIQSPITAQKRIGWLTAGGVAVHLLVTAEVP